MPQKLSSFFGKTLTASASGINTAANIVSPLGSFGNTNELPSGTSLNVIPTSTGIAGLFSGTTSSDMVRITQLGTGNALVVEDSANPDATPFVVTGIGSVGIGTTNPRFKLEVGAVGASGTSLHVNGDAQVTGKISSEESAIFMNPNSISRNTTIPSNYNAQSVGPSLTVNSGINVTVSAGGEWTIT